MPDVAGSTYGIEELERQSGNQTGLFAGPFWPELQPQYLIKLKLKMKSRINLIMVGLVAVCLG